MNGMLLQDALFGLLLLCLICSLFVQSVRVYGRTSAYTIREIETKWFYHD